MKYEYEWIAITRTYASHVRLMCKTYRSYPYLWTSKRLRGRPNQCCKFAVNWLPTFFCINWLKCNNTHLLQICSGLISVVKFKREKLKPKQLFLQLKIVLPWSGARRKDEIQFSLFVHLWLSFLGWHFYA